MKLHQLAVIAVVLVAGVGITAFMLKQAPTPAHTHDDHGHGHGHGDDAEAGTAPAFEHGPHNGRMLRDGAFAIEVTIFEDGVPPQFRMFAYESDQPVDPGKVSLSAMVSRLGDRVDHHTFHKEGDYLTSSLVVYEPHSFHVTVTADYGGKSHTWDYDSPEARVEISDEAAKGSGIVVKTAGPAHIRTEIEAPGEVRLNAEKVAHQLARFEGIVTEVRKSTGDRVTRGEVIAVLESRALAGARGEYIEAVHRLELAQSRFVREENLWKKRITAEQDYLQARHEMEESEIQKQAARQKLLALGLTLKELTELAVEPDGKVVTFQVRQPFPDRSLTRYELHASMDGTVIERNVSLGQTVHEDAVLFQIADLSTVWVEITLYPRQLPSVAVGQKATIVSTELKQEAQGTVSYISPVLNEPSRTGRARVVLPNPDGAWRPGLFVRARLIHEESEVSVAVKPGALQAFRDWQVVFLNDSELYEPVVVETGRRDADWVEITSGLKAGQRYAAEGSFVIKADILKSGATHDH